MNQEQVQFTPEQPMRQLPPQELAGLGSLAMYEVEFGGSPMEPGAIADTPITEDEIANFMADLDALGEMTEAPDAADSPLSDADRAAGLSDEMFINSAQAEANAGAQYALAAQQREWQRQQDEYTIFMQERQARTASGSTTSAVTKSRPGNRTDSRRPGGRRIGQTSPNRTLDRQRVPINS